MIAMTSCVKGLAAPGPTPGPWEASAGLAQSKAAAGISESAKGDLQSHFLGDAMTISCVSLQKIRIAAYAGFDVA
jgi:hypothetical protein